MSSPCANHDLQQAIEGYKEKLESHAKEFDNLFQRIVLDTNKLIDRNPDFVYQNDKDIESFIEDLMLSGAWIKDRLNGVKHLYNKKSNTNQVRNLLGFNTFI